MTDPELRSLYRDVVTFLKSYEANPHANVEPVTPQEARWARRMLAGGGFSGGKCDICGMKTLHGHPA